MHAWYAIPMTERITITLPDDLVAELDAIATGSGRSRSGVIREASAKYVTEHQTSEKAFARQAAGTETLAYLTKLRSLPVHDDRQTLDILRELRGSLDVEGA